MHSIVYEFTSLIHPETDKLYHDYLAINVTGNRKKPRGDLLPLEMF